MNDEPKNKQVYEAFSAAWRDKDLVGLGAVISDDVIYGGSVGPEPGTTYRGRESVMAGFADMLAFDPGTSFDDHVVFAGDRAYVEWSYRTSEAGKETVAVRGMDIFVFKDGKVARKEAFRKALGVRPPRAAK